MKKLCGIMLGLVMVCSLVLGTTAIASAAGKTIMSIGIGQSDKHPQYFGLIKFKEVVESRTNGRFEVQVNHSGVVGDDRGMMEALQLGTLDGTCPSTAVIANFVPAFAIFDFPYLFPDTKTADTILEGPIGQELLEKLTEVGMVGMNYWELGFLNVTNSKRRILKTEDFNGLKIRTMENTVHLDTLRAFGANPTPMAFSELFTAMQQGTVDGQQNPEASIWAMKFYEVQPYMTLTQHVYGPFVFLISNVFWNKLSDEDKVIFKEAAKLAMEEEKRLLREENARLHTELAAKGMTIDELKPGEKEKMLELVKPVVAKHADKVGKDLVEKMYKAVADLK